MRLRSSLALSVAVPLLFSTPSATVPRLAGNPEEDRAYAILAAGSESKDPQTRLQTIVASSMIGRNPSVLLRLEKALTDRDVAVRVAAANALGDFKAKETTPALRKTLHDDEVPEVAFAAAKALYILNDPAGKEALTQVFDRRISGQSSMLRKQARDFFGRFHTLKSSLTFIVSEGIGFAPVPGAGAGFSAVSELLTDPELSTRASVVLLLGRAKDRQTTELLRIALADKDWSVRAAAAQSIAQTARKELQTNLVALFDDNKEKVRFRAAGAYIHLALKTTPK